MRFNIWYSLPVAAVVIAAFLMTSYFSVEHQSAPVEAFDQQATVSEHPEKIEADSTSVSESVENVSADQASTDLISSDQSSTDQASPDQAAVGQSREQGDSTAQLKQAGAETQKALAPETHRMKILPMVGSNITAPNESVNQN